MKKIILSICLLVNVVLYADTCLDKYQPLFDLIDKTYSKPYQTYKFVPLDIVPVFCLDAATKTQIKGDMIYLCNLTTIKRYIGKGGGERVIIAIVNYQQSICPTVKTYKILFYYCDSITKTWTEDRKPIIITMQLQDKHNCWYSCTSIEK